MTIKPVCPAIVATVLFSTAVAAHHSHGDFLLDQRTTVEGVVERVEFKNPHTFVVLRADDMTVWMAEWTSALLLTQGSAVRAAVTKDTLKVGDFLVVVGIPHKDAKRHELALTSLTRPSDGWHWPLRP